MNVRQRLRSRLSTFSGFLTFSIVAFGVPMGIWGMWINYNQGTLTPSWAVWCVLVGLVAGAGWGIAVWFTAMKMLIQRIDRGSKPQ